MTGEVLAESTGLTMGHAGGSISYGPMNNCSSGSCNLFHQPYPCKLPHKNSPTRILEELFPERLNLYSKWIQAVKGVDSSGCWGAAPRSPT